MPNYPLPENETERLQQLEALDIMDSLEEDAFDRITRMAMRTLKTPIALITLLDDQRQWFKSKIGIDVSQTPREHAFCTHAICNDEIMEVEDATKDERFANNPLVLGDPEIRFYAGAPLHFKDAFNLGTLCIIDTKPRQLNDEERTMLRDLAGIVSEQLEARQTAQRAQKTEKRLIDAVDAIPDGFIIFDKDDKLVMSNQRYKEMYSVTADLIEPGIKFPDLIRLGVERGQYPEAIGNEEAWIEDRLKNRRLPNNSLEQLLPDDRWLRIQERHTSDGDLVSFRVDITQLKRQQRELSRLAWTDGLTGALNRRRFVDLVNSEINRGQRTNAGNAALILIDVDYFKKINDLFGHAAGDQVLIELVKRWNIELRDYDHLARIGGEEFAILLPECDKDGAEQAIERLIKNTAKTPIHVKGVDITVTVSGGLIMLDADKDTVDTALAHADEALYKAKNQGRNCFVSKAA